MYVSHRMKTFHLNGNDFSDMSGFYQSIYRLMPLEQDWEPGHNLDALNDVLYGGFGDEPVSLVWVNAEKSRKDLGLEQTALFYQRKIDQGAPYNVDWAKQKLADLHRGKGQTLFDIILEILADHRYITVALR